MEIAFGAQDEVYEAVARKLLQHVVEEADTGGDIECAGAVEIDAAADLGLTRDALNARLAGRWLNGGGSRLGHSRSPHRHRPAMLIVPAPATKLRSRAQGRRRDAATRD